MSEARKLTMAVHQGRFVKRSGRQDWPEAADNQRRPTFDPLDPT
jgi:hypothetical protein